MFLAGAQNIEAKKEFINELNVFPVPDGDTGTNMSLTIMSAAKEVTALSKPKMKDLAKAISSGSLRGARGNSGVILSQLLRGFTKSIREEKEHIRGYLEIQQVRYRDILDYEIDIDEELYQYKILKLTLQPLVENSLYHGIKYKRAKGKIWITGRMEPDVNAENDRLLLCVQDNGVGMDEEELERLRIEIGKPCKETERGFGLANVNERIRMNFGVEYGMEIDSAPGQGTCVEVVIPAIPYEG